MDFAIAQSVRVARNCIVAGEYLKKGEIGTITAISESPESPVIFVAFERWVLPMRVHEIEAKEES